MSKIKFKFYILFFPNTYFYVTPVDLKLLNIPTATAKIFIKKKKHVV